MAADIVAACLPGVASIDRADWARLHPSDAEDHAYLTACESAPTAAVGTGAIVVRQAGRVVAAAPLFALTYRLDTPLQGKLQGLGEALHRYARPLVEHRLLGIGSPLLDGAGLGIDPELSAAERHAVLQALVTELDLEAERRGAVLLVVKDLRGDDALARLFSARRYAEVRSLPFAVLDLQGLDEAGYLARLSPATRKDVRRKLKRSQALAVEHVSGSLGGAAGEIEALYESTRQASEVRYGDFEELPEGYFARVVAAMGERARVALYRRDGRLIAFNLLLVGPDRIIDKFLGMSYPDGPENDVYVRSWMENVRLCLATGRRYLQTGQTAYREKLRLGSALDPSVNLVRYRNRVVNGLVRLAAPWLALDRYDPDLGRLRAEGKA